MSLRKNLQYWVENADLFAPSNSFTDSTKNWDPSSYSIDEWEEYLKRKNHNLTFKQWIKSRRMRPYIYACNASEYIEKMTYKKERALEFVSEEDYDYMMDFINFIYSSNPPTGGRSGRRIFSFCLKYKCYPSMDTNSPQYKIIRQIIQEDLDRRRSIMQSRGKEFILEKTRIYNVISDLNLPF